MSDPAPARTPSIGNALDALTSVRHDFDCLPGEPGDCRVCMIARTLQTVRPLLEAFRDYTEDDATLDKIDALLAGEKEEG